MANKSLNKSENTNHNISSEFKNLISVIVPCYNIDNYIEYTIKSVLDSSHKEIELILVNDGSTDNTLSILKKYEASNHRIIIIDKKNAGVSSARNIGLNLSRGEYIYFLDGDDTIEKNLFENALKIFNENSKIDIFSFGFDIVSEDNKQLKNYSFKHYNHKIFTNEEFLNLYFTKKLRQSMCSFIVRKKILLENRIKFSEDVSYAEDHEVQIKLLLNSYLVYYDAKCYFHYLKRMASAINSAKPNFDSLIVFRRLKPYLESKTSTLSVRNSFYNYTSFFFILKWKDGILNRRDKTYFEDLNSFSECLKYTKFSVGRYGIIAYLFSKFYLIWKIIK